MERAPTTQQLPSCSVHMFVSRVARIVATVNFNLLNQLIYNVQICHLFYNIDVIMENVSVCKGVFERQETKAAHAISATDITSDNPL